MRRFRAEALTDALTGLGNRRRLMADLEQRRGGARASRGSLLLFDLDGFKAYNDAFGHAGGTRCSSISRAASRPRSRRGARVPPRG